MTNKPRIQVILTDKEYEIIKEISENKNLSISKTAEIIIANGIKKIEKDHQIII